MLYALPFSENHLCGVLLLRRNHFLFIVRTIITHGFNTALFFLLRRPLCTLLRVSLVMPPSRLFYYNPHFSLKQENKCTIDTFDHQQTKHKKRQGYFSLPLSLLFFIIISQLSAASSFSSRLLIHLIKSDFIVSMSICASPSAVLKCLFAPFSCSLPVYYRFLRKKPKMVRSKLSSSAF